MYFGKGIEPVVEHASLAGQITEARDRLTSRKINASECFSGIKWLVAADPTGGRIKPGGRGKETLSWELADSCHPTPPLFMLTRLCT